MKVSVIIRCLNEARHLPKLLDSLGRQTLKPFEVVVVDSGSTDNSVDIARSKGARVVHIQPEQFSFGRSLNLGARNASGDIMIIASAHIYPVSDRWLEWLAKPFQDSAIALTYGGQHGEERSQFSEQQLFKQWFPEDSTQNQGHSFCNNANAAVRRSVWLTMPYDEEIPALEDIHWAKRAIERGFRIAYVANAAIIHVHEESYAQVYRRYRREAMGMHMIFPWERMSLRQAFSLAVNAMISDVKQARKENLLTSVVGSIVRFRAAQYWGTYRGLNHRGAVSSNLRARFYYPKNYRIKKESASNRPEIIVEK
jgi:glycosyltransferase involved in cell wall biosynthesis